MEFFKSIKLRYTAGQPVIRLRELSGMEEISIQDSSTASAIRLINGLIENNEQFNAKQIVTADRDYILSLIYMEVYGSKVEGRANCKSCGQLFEISFQLPELQKHLYADSSELDERHNFQFEEYSFRLPTGEDELAVAGMPEDQAIDELLRLCVTGGSVYQGDKIQEAMSRIAPVLQAELKSVCPECGVSQEARFDIQTYLLSKLKGEEKILLREIHRLAYAYKWSHQEILSLPRRLRQRYSKIIDEMASS